MQYLSRICLVIIALSFAIAVPSVAEAESGKLALRGYDPVNYFTQGQPAKGSPEFSYVWDGERYLFANLKHRDMFASDPARYAPQFPGHCAAALAAGHVLAANPEYWIILNGNLYLFGSPGGPERFRSDPQLARSAQKNWMRTRNSE